MRSRSRYLTAGLAAGLLFTGSSLAQPSFDDLGFGVAPGLVIGDQIPLLEVDAQFRLVGEKATFKLTRNGEEEILGYIRQRGLGGLIDGEYEFRRSEDGEAVVKMDWKDLTFDPGFKMDLKDGRGNEIGRIRQRALFSIGAGIDVYRNGEKDRSYGYVDQKTWASLGHNLGVNLIDGVTHILEQQIYQFNANTWVEEEQDRFTTFGRGWGGKVTRDVKYERPLFRFVGAELNVGPGGLLIDPDGNVLLAVKGDWWMSKDVFALAVPAREADGAVGEVLWRIGEVAEALSDEGDSTVRDSADDLVRNPTCYVGAFLTGLVYFPEFQQAVGLDLLPTRAD